MNKPQADLFPGALPKEIGHKDIAKLFGVTTQRITQLAVEGMPKAGRNRYPLAESVQWLVNYWKTKGTRSGDQLESHRKRLLKAQAKKAEIDNEIRTRELIPADAIATTMNKLAITVASQLEALAPRLANELTNQSDPAYVKKTINDETRQIRIAIADLVDDLATTAGSGEHNPAAADKVGE